MARTDNDDWDLASSVGSTATWVAAGRALASKQPDPLINDPYAEALVKAVGLDYCNRMADGTLDFNADPLLDKRQVCERIAVRTRFFDDFCIEAGRAGIRQAVILASGLDTRAYRLDWPADMVVFEIDQPQVIEFKTGVLADLGAAPTAKRRSVSVDLRGDWPEALRASGFDATRPTAWIAEGLLMYLPPEAQDRLLDTVTTLSALGSRLATDDIDAVAMSGDWAKRLTEGSRRAGSDIDAAGLFYSGQRNSVRDHLAAQRWRVSITSTADAYAANGFAPPVGELAAATGPGYLTATLDG
ncbi:class I SAM-dependent methyltransferase [Mycobacterium malmoense]|uniref:S-adenosyl-L-methionine-dependent methyltransferase n=1 Tax=Mycobacterium malmoense TaxID=1780 RepID=A0ABX3SQ89_MYCMA|nr:class I SAM-dependent methyltransferase [Mycobacterium malmoense]ORA80884.1 SAM-dependent methyltransferase [Mycobacterium malmoense]QZA15748.1 class I SAM-dependent methyltransferase [Mycobacterium malmoense]UNB92563.1 class I SAM-dependent methyltransferase [Mycobacterium malmoense]